MPSLMPFSLCSCYPNRKSSQKSEEFIVVDGEEPYARIVKKRNSSRHASSGGSQMDACTTFPASLPRRLNDHPNYRLSIAGEIDIDEISGYATIMKTPKLPRRTAELSSCHEPFQNDIGNVIGVRKASSASQSHINNTSFGSNTLPAKSKLPVYTKPVRRPSVPSRSSLNSINNNKIEIIRRTTVRRSQDTSSSSLSGRRSSSDSGSSLSTMAMIATVHPYNRRNSSGISAGVGVGNGAGAVAESGGFKIEDVTDDPKYKSDDESELEGALVEYCRIDSRHRTPPQHNICEADTIVSARSHAPGGHYEIKDTRLHPAITTSSTAASSPLQRLRGVAASETVVNKAFPVTVAQPKMAYVVDIEVGQPCSAKAQCKCFGFRPHQWRKVCVHCKCDRSEHELGPNQVLNVYERLGIAPPSEMAAVMKNQRNDVPGSVSHGYAWVPPGLTRIKVEEYMSQLPNHVIPRLNSLGEKYREKQLMLQLPKQDLSIAYCKNLRTPVEKRIYEEFINGRNEVALDIGYVSPSIAHSMECRKCRGALDKGDMAVMAPKLGENAAWHPACFICATCEQLLVDLTYCVREDKIHCERHYAELHKPRCSACDELIFSGEYTKAMNKDWHSDHFCCWNCDTTLTGQRYILRDEHPFCIKCYEEVFANTCDECGKSIGIDSKDLSWAQKHWHEDCFLCNMCKISLVDKPFGSKNDRIFCSNCYDQAFATRCDGCNEIFRAGMKKMEYKGKQWHDKCFCCASCKVPIGTKSFIPKNEDVYCATCYEDKFATRCSKCSKVITTGGVTYKQSPWHRECFCCTNCNVSLAGQRFTSKDDKPYCAACYGDLFAKRCNACLKPITGIGGAKFISFEDRHWHNDCFICAQCTTSLVGKGFITDASDILCPECAKARLMAANS